MTTEEFRSSPELVAEMRKILESHVLKQWLEAMDSEHPVNNSAPRGTTAEDACIMLGEQTGWQQFKNRFLLGGLGVNVRIKPPIQKYLEPADQQ